MDNQPTPVIPPQLDMIRFLLDTLKSQGLSFLLLGLAVWHLQSQNDALATEIRACQEDKYNALVEIIRANTEALQHLTNGKEEQEKEAAKPRKQ